MQRFTNNMTHAVRNALAAGMCLVLAGCNSYSHVTRQDTISPTAGDAVHGAKLMQTVDPWPEYVLDTDIAMDDEVALKRANDCKAGKTKELDGARAAGGNTAQP